MFTAALQLCLLNGINKLNSYSAHAVCLFFVHHTIYCSSHGVLSWTTAYGQRLYNSNNLFLFYRKRIDTSLCCVMFFMIPNPLKPTCNLVIRGEEIALDSE